MKTWRRALMELDPAGRLETAIMWLEEMAGTEPEVAALQHQFGLTPNAARILAALNAASPRMLTKAQLYRVLYPADDEVEIKIIDVYLSRIRQRLAPGAIVTHWGLGYSLPAALPITVAAPAPPPEKHREDWTPQDDANLLRMFKAGSDYAAMAEDLDRSPRAIENRLQALRAAGKFIGPVPRVPA